jgi:phage antirepressor YoqD-like protein
MENSSKRVPVQIAGTEIQKIEYRGQQVVTFAMVDRVHGRPRNTAGRNFRENRDRFIEGEDFIKICADEIRRHKIIDLSPKAREDVFFLTQRGYLKLTKPMNDDQAWRVQGEMINRYFGGIDFPTETVPAFKVPQTYAEALRLAADQSEVIETQKAAIIELQPKAEFHDAVTGAINAQPIRDIAKVLGTGQNRMFKWLRERGILMGNNTPYQRYVEEGYFRLVEKQWTDPVGESHTYTRTLVTGKGLTYLQRKWSEDHPTVVKGDRTIVPTHVEGGNA